VGELGGEVVTVCEHKVAREVLFVQVNVRPWQTLREALRGKAEQKPDAR